MSSKSYHNSFSIEEKRDEKVSWLVGAYFIASTANMTMKTVLPIPEDYWGLVSAAWGVVIVFFMLRGASIVLSRSKQLILSSLLITGALYMYSFLLISFRTEPTTVLTSGIGIPTLIFWLPVGIYACSVYNMKILYRVMLRSSYVLTVLLFTCFLFRNGASVNGEEAKSYNMFFGYSMAFTSLFQLNEFYRNKNKKLLLLVIIQILLILIYANRGALLSIGFFVFYKLVLDQVSIIKKVLWVVLLLVTLSALVFFSEEIAVFGIDILGGFNMESRTLQKMAAASLSESDARDELRMVALKMIEERPIFGWGIGGECYTIAARTVGIAEASHAYSPHNGILQHMLYFGIIAGNILNILLIVPIFKLHRIKNEYQHGIILACCSAYFITTLWSSCDILLKPAVAIYIYLSYFYSKKSFRQNEYSKFKTAVS